MSEPFVLMVCADLFGEKTNLQLLFSSRPTTTQLHKRIIEEFIVEADVKRPPRIPVFEFTVQSLQVFDDAHIQWVDVLQGSQLHPYDQLYASQPESQWHTETQQDLPAPRLPSNQRFLQTDFKLLACCDLLGAKVNVELTFHSTPTLPQLHECVVDTFSEEARQTVLARPPEQQPREPLPNIMVDTIMIFDDLSLQWKELADASQLHMYGQLYVFQPATAESSETQTEMPPPRVPRRASPRTRMRPLIRPPPPPPPPMSH